MSRQRDKLYKMFFDLGAIITSFSPATGYWRTDPRADCYRWEAFGYKLSTPNLPLIIGSYDTMTDCARYGFTVTEDGPCDWDVFAKLPERAKYNCGCVAVTTGTGETFVKPLKVNEQPEEGAKRVIRDFNLYSEPGETFVYTVVKETNDPEEAYGLAKKREALGRFTLDAPPTI